MRIVVDGCTWFRSRTLNTILFLWNGAKINSILATQIQFLYNGSFWFVQLSVGRILRPWRRVTI